MVKLHRFLGGSPLFFTDYDKPFVAYEATIPEPTALIIWSLLGSLGITIGWWRRKRAA